MSLFLFVTLFSKLRATVGCAKPVCNELESGVGLALDNCDEIVIKVSLRVQLHLVYSRLAVDLQSVNLELEY